jgi:hypothetical protein
MPPPSPHPSLQPHPPPKPLPPQPHSSNNGHNAPFMMITSFYSD